MSQEVLPNIPEQRYRGLSKPEMPYSVSTKSSLPLKVLARSGAKKLIGFFLKTVVTEVGTPEYNGYNTTNSHEQGHTVRPATEAIYIPLVDTTPVEPDQCSQPWSNSSVSLTWPDKCIRSLPTTCSLAISYCLQCHMDISSPVPRTVFPD